MTKWVIIGVVVVRERRCGAPILVRRQLYLPYMVEVVVIADLYLVVKYTKVPGIARNAGDEIPI